MTSKPAPIVPGTDESRVWWSDEAYQPVRIAGTGGGQAENMPMENDTAPVEPSSPACTGAEDTTMADAAEKGAGHKQHQKKRKIVNLDDSTAVAHQSPAEEMHQSELTCTNLTTNCTVKEAQQHQLEARKLWIAAKQDLPPLDEALWARLEAALLKNAKEAKASSPATKKLPTDKAPPSAPLHPAAPIVPPALPVAVAIAAASGTTDPSAAGPAPTATMPGLAIPPRPTMGGITIHTGEPCPCPEPDVIELSSDDDELRAHHLA
ncbi:hypothetical protein A0H81_14670 [Grifola frondosa]|uniref:Uncharacterized protein n=1 Tax=Grifola frondosa TaxID=5627 RepID=A0A1C7LKS3_GRIFR|nr:hypothetical protein A0H81_14670 [Grifola frondosa]